MEQHNMGPNMWNMKYELLIHGDGFEYFSWV